MEVTSLLADLSPAQREAVETPTSPLCILAGAGSGKTRVLTRRIAYRIATGTADPGHILALTFTRRAAGELGDRLRALDVRPRLTAGTFHGVAYAQLRQYWADRGQPAPQLLDRKSGFLARLVAGRPDMSGVAIAELAAEIEWASARLITPEQYPAAAAEARRRLPVPAEAMAGLLARYQTEKVRRRVADFDDLLRRCALAMEEDPAFAAVQRWRWRHVFVDEFQDVNPLQYRLLTAWLGGRDDVCVVGDPNQAVYGWNGADPSLLERLPDRWPGTQVIHLDDNHRCSPQVVATAAGVLGSPPGRLRSSRPDGPPTVVRAYPDDASEAHGVVAEVRERRAEGLPWSQMAILMRTNAQVPLFEAACRAAQIPYRLAGARRLLDDPEIQALLVDVGRRRAEPFEAMTADLANAVREVEDPHREARRSLVGLARDFEQMETRPTIDGFLSWLGPATSRDRCDVGPAGVTISTFHRAKGLEWESVWVTGLEDGLVPIIHAQTVASHSEERRLLYVALTRAAQELRCSWAGARRFADHAVPRAASPWLEAIAGRSASDDRPAVTPQDQWKARLATQRDRLAGCRRPGSGLPGLGSPGTPQSPSASGGLRSPWDAGDPQVIDALRVWRAAASRAAGVPVHVVLHDATLAAVAALRPTTDEELLAVPGLGPVKASRYGAVLLDLVAAHRASA